MSVPASLRFPARLLLPALALGTAAAQAPRPPAATAPSLPPVEISALGDPVEKSYRRIVDGMDLFERRRAQAPQAILRFRLLPRRADTDMEDIELAIVGDSVRIPVPVAADRSFTLPRSPRALRENATVVPNRRARSMTWRVDIRTPGLPPDTRRLGDLRLECAVGMEAELVSESRSAFDRLARLIADRGYCERREPRYLFFADRPLWRVTLVHGERREDLSVDRLYAGVTRDPIGHAELRHCDCEVLIDRAYFAPLGDPGWPDDTLLTFEYIDDGEPPR